MCNLIQIPKLEMIVMADISSYMLGYPGFLEFPSPR